MCAIVREKKERLTDDTLAICATRMLLDLYADAPTECDGHTSLVAHLLIGAGVPFHAWVGALRRGDAVIAPHYWATLGPGQPGDAGCVVIDYRRRMWVGEDVCEGVLRATDLGDTTYHDARELFLDRLPAAVFWALTTR